MAINKHFKSSAIATTLEAIENFAQNLDYASCQGSRRDAVEFLARRVGKIDARKIAEAFGLYSEFYFATLD